MPHAEYESSPEGRLWHAVLATYYVDVCKTSLTKRRWEAIWVNANSAHTKKICGMINLDHSFFIQNLLRVKQNRKSIDNKMLLKIWRLR